MKTNPWYSTEQDEELIEAPVHHNNMVCKPGKLVEKNHRRYGTDNRPLCKRCVALNEAGK